jgi:hypothetical protein
MKVSINAGGREVIIETGTDQNISHAEVADKALEVWRETAASSTGTGGPAFGVQVERRPGRAEPHWTRRDGEPMKVDA